MKHRGRILARQRLWNKLVNNYLAPIHEKLQGQKHSLWGWRDGSGDYRFPISNADSPQLSVNPTSNPDTKYHIWCHILTSMGLRTHLHLHTHGHKHMTIKYINKKALFKAWSKKVQNGLASDSPDMRVWHGHKDPHYSAQTNNIHKSNR